MTTTTMTVRNIYSGHTFPIKFHSEYDPLTSTQGQARRYLADHPYLRLVSMTSVS